MKPYVIESRISTEDAGKAPLSSANGVLPYTFSLLQSPYSSSRFFNLSQACVINLQLGCAQRQDLPEGQCHGLDMSRQDRRGVVEVSKLTDQW